MGNIAGVPHNKLVAECTDEEFERILAINLKSVFYGCQAAIRHMIPQGSGNIVNIASGAIDTPAPTLACYGMTKAAVTMLTKTLATEVGRHGIRVNAIAPGMILTNFSRHNFVDERRQRRPREARAVPQERGPHVAARPRRRRRKTSRGRSSTSSPTPPRSSPARSNAPTAASRCLGNSAATSGSTLDDSAAGRAGGLVGRRPVELGDGRSSSVRSMYVRSTRTRDSTGGPTRVPVR